MKLNQGYVQIYTGNGKGKTTAAIGQVIRAIGNGLKVYFVSFMKDYPYGEVKILENLSANLVLKRYGNDAFVFEKQPAAQELINEVQDGLLTAKEKMLSGKYDIIVLDEILVSIYFKLFTEKQVLDFIKIKPKNVELILTGRYCPQQILDVADLVTKMNEHKHYYQKGVTARTGIES